MAPDPLQTRAPGARFQAPPPPVENRLHRPCFLVSVQNRMQKGTKTVINCMDRDLYTSRSTNLRWAVVAHLKLCAYKCVLRFDFVFTSLLFIWKSCCSCAKYWKELRIASKQRLTSKVRLPGKQLEWLSVCLSVCQSRTQSPQVLWPAVAHPERLHNQTI